MQAPIQEWLSTAKDTNERNPIVRAVDGLDWMLKFRPDSVSEVFSFELARLIGISVPRVIAVWNVDPVDAEPWHTAEPYRIGLISQWIDGLSQQVPETAAQAFPLNTARALILFLFCRHERGEFMESGGTGYVVDLQGLLLLLVPEELHKLNNSQRRREVREAVKMFGWCGNLDIQEFVEWAHEFGLWPQFSAELPRALGSIANCFGPDFTALDGYPFADVLIDGMRKAVTLRIDRIRRQLPRICR